jgi:hypothetical protein
MIGAILAKHSPDATSFHFQQLPSTPTPVFGEPGRHGLASDRLGFGIKNQPQMRFA